MRQALVSLLCGWVLWSTPIEAKPESWQPFDSYERLADCKRDEQKLRTTQPRPKPDVRWLCMPGTLNLNLLKSN